MGIIKGNSGSEESEQCFELKFIMIWIMHWRRILLWMSGRTLFSDVMRFERRLAASFVYDLSSLLLSSVSLSLTELLSNFLPTTQNFKSNFHFWGKKVVSHETHPYLIHDPVETPLVWVKLIFRWKTINLFIFSPFLIGAFLILRIWKFGNFSWSGVSGCESVFNFAVLWGSC